MRNLSLLVAVLMLTACATSPIQYVPRSVPPLDSELAAPCPQIPDPPQTPDDYDAWQLWVQDQVLVLWAICARRHFETVAAWPR
jgi:hypothetical protein